MALLDPDRLFPPEPTVRDLARELHRSVADLPIISPHGHTDPAWYALDEPFPDPAQLFVVPDHYVLRMLASAGLRLEELGVAPLDGGPHETDGRAIWRRFASHYDLFRGTPSRLWIDHALSEVLGWHERLSGENADRAYDHVAERLARPEFRPRALYERFGIEAIATTDAATDPLDHHRAIRESDWVGRVLPTYRPDGAVDPEAAGFTEEVDRLGAMTGEDVGTWEGYLAAHRARRAAFIAMGATATDHGHPTARTASLPRDEAAALYDRVRGEARRGEVDAGAAETFRAQMLTEMARMSLHDGLVMQIHAGSHRNHAPAIHARFGRDKGFDMPTPGEFTRALGPLLAEVGLEPDLTVVLFTLDETTYARELAPLAGAYPALRLGPPWWFHDSYEGMRRFREQVTETAGFANTVGFNDDTRAYLSIPARHDVARRCDAAYLATLARTGRLAEDEAFEVAHDLAYALPKRAYRL